MDLSRLVYEYNKATASLDGIDLVTQMVVIDYADRITPRDALCHRYFDKDYIRNSKYYK